VEGGVRKSLEETRCEAAHSVSFRAPHPSKFDTPSRRPPEWPEMQVFLKLAHPTGQTAMGTGLTDSGYDRAMDDRTKIEDKTETAEQHEAFKKMLLRFLDEQHVGR
jgi:hypothetical protein